jgi:hypothetical protein
VITNVVFLPDSHHALSLFFYFERVITTIVFLPDSHHALSLFFNFEKVIINVVFLLPLPAALAELTSSSPS